jgi:hypothetical protein
VRRCCCCHATHVRESSVRAAFGSSPKRKNAVIDLDAEFS